MGLVTCVILEIRITLIMSLLLLDFFAYFCNSYRVWIVLEKHFMPSSLCWVNSVWPLWFEAHKWCALLLLSSQVAQAPAGRKWKSLHKNIYDSSWKVRVYADSWYQPSWFKRSRVVVNVYACRWKRINWKFWKQTAAWRRFHGEDWVGRKLKFGRILRWICGRGVILSLDFSLLGSAVRKWSLQPYFL